MKCLSSCIAFSLCCVVAFASSFAPAWSAQPSAPPAPPSRVVAAAAAITAAAGDVVVCDPSGGGFTVTLPPTGSGVNRGRGVLVVNGTSSTNTITIAAQGSGVTVDGAASVGLATAWASRWVVSDGNDWVTASGGSIDAARIVSGTVAAARLGSGSASATTYLRGNSTWGAGTCSLVLGTTAVHNPLDATTYYAGQIGQAITTTGGTRRVTVPITGTIVAAAVNVNAVTAVGTNESWTFNVRLNNSSSTLIGSVAANTSYRVVTNTAMSVAVTAGDYVELEVVCPTWVTNPQGVTYWVTLVVAG